MEKDAAAAAFKENVDEIKEGKVRGKRGNVHDVLLLPCGGGSMPLIADASDKMASR
jgi:hypothetical protein